MSILIFIAVLSVLVLVHEWGHFITARSLGVKVEKFSLGFGPKLFSWVSKGTEYMLCAIPLGGYVKMAGDERNETKGTPEEYYSHPPGHRALIVLMGPVVNYVLAYLCFVVVYMTGYPTIAPKIGEVLDGYPAQTAGLQKGDIIVDIDGNNVQSWEDVQKSIALSGKDKLNFSFLREGKKIEKSIVPQHKIQKNIFGQEEDTKVVGISPEEEMISLKYGFVESLVKSFDGLWDITITTYKALFRMVTGSMEAKDAMTGPIGIFYIIKKAAEMGFTYLLYIVGIISASLAIFNLLPFPVLDGGHIFLLAVEKIRGQALPAKVDEIIARIGFSLIICLALFVFYIDFNRFGLVEKIVGLWKQLGL